MSGITPREVVVRYVEAVAAGDAETVAASFAPDATWTYPGDLPLSGTWRGRTEIVEGFLTKAAGGLFRAGGPEIALVGTVAEGDTVVAEWTAKGTAATGRAYDNVCLGVFTVRDGRITAVREFSDTHHVATALFGADGPQ